MVPVLAMLARTAGAQATDDLGIERFRPAVDRAGILDVEWAGTPGHLKWSAGALVGFAHDPLVIYTNDGRAAGVVVDGRFTTNLVGAIGIGSRLAIGVGADIIGYQSGADMTPAMTSLPGSGVGDVRLLAKGTFLSTSTLQVGAIGTLTIPGGSGGGYLREAGVGFSPALAASVRSGALRGALNAGVNIRPRVDTVGVVSDDELFGRIGIAAEVPALGELWWATSLAKAIGDGAPDGIAVEMFVGAAHAISPMVGVFVAGGVGLDNAFGTPDWRVLGGVRFGSPPPAVVVAPVQPPVLEPTPPAPPVDTDRDGIVDDNDKCPKIAESPNGFRDDDGCPEEPAKLSGRVVDPDGRPIAGATITVTDELAKRPLTLASDDAGVFAYTGPIGGATTVSATAPEYEPGTAQVELEPGQSRDVTVTLVRKVRQGQLRGQVLSFDGKPLQATVSVTGKTGAPTSATADAEGNFSIDLPEGAFQVEISADGYKAQKRSVKIKLDGVTVLNVDMRGTK